MATETGMKALPYDYSDCVSMANEMMKRAFYHGEHTDLINISQINNYSSAAARWFELIGEAKEQSIHVVVMRNYYPVRVYKSVLGWVTVPQ